MNVRAAIAEGTGLLERASPGSPFLDAVLLLCHAMNLDKEHLLASMSDEVSGDHLSVYRKLLSRRAAGVPVAYILGWREFYGRRFAVDDGVLVPRPDTEVLVDVALGLLPEPVKPKVDTPDRRRVSPDAAGTAPSGELTERAARVHDAFCGSGCVGISIAAERPDIQLELSDLSEHALAVAAINAGALLPGCFVGFGCGTVLSSATGRFDLITANPDRKSVV